MRGKVNITKGLGIIIVMFMALFMVPANGQAVTAPDVQQLEGITMGKNLLYSPGRLALDSIGNLYAVDAYKNHILKFDANGSYIGDIAVPNVSALAVAPDGTLYIGSNIDYAVSIVRNGNVMGYLGNGKNEFRSVSKISFDRAGNRVYVIDNIGNAVRIFDTTGADLGTIKGVTLPVSIDVTDREICIIDAPSVRGNNIYRIVIFDKEYNVISTIEEKAGERILYRPTDVVVLDGIIYVTDAALRSVLLFDMSGSYLGEIQGQDGGIYTAVSLVLSRDGILYVSSSETHSIYMFALNARPAAVNAGGLGN